jgi:hypothetical protein
MYYLLVPNALRSKLLLVFSPVLGFIWLIVSSTWLSYLGLSAEQYSIYLLSVTILVSFYFLYKNRANLKEQFEKYNFLVVFFSLISGLIILLPYIKFNAFYPYIDGYTYISIADFLLKHGYFDSADQYQYHPWLTQMKLYQGTGLRIGAQVFLAFMTSIFSQKMSINLFIPVSAVSQSILVLITWLFCSYGLKIPNKYSLVAILFVSLHVGMPIGNLINGFFPQHFGMIVFMFPFIYLYRISDYDDKISKFKIILSSSLAVACLVMSYSELLPFFVISFLCVNLYYLLFTSYKLVVFKHLVLVGIISIIFSNIALYYSLRALPIQLEAVVGWDIKQTVWQYILQLTSMLPLFYNLSSLNGSLLIKSLANITALFIIITMFRGIFLNKRSEGKKMLFATSIIFVLVIFYFLFFKRNPWNPQETGQNWSVMKAIQYSFFLIPPLVAFGVEGLKKYSKLLMVIIFGFFIVLSINNNYKYALEMTQPMRYYTGNDKTPLKEYWKLKDVIENEKRPIYISVPDSQNNHRRMISYFLQEKELISNWNSDGYYHWKLEVPQRNDAVYLIYNPDAKGNSIANMKLVKDSLELITEGMYDPEENEYKNKWTWSPPKSKLIIVNGFQSSVTASIKFYLWDTNKNNTTNKLQIFNDNKLIKEYIINNGDNEKKQIELTLPPGPTNISFSYLGEAIKYEGEIRNLAFAIGDLEVIKNN